MIDRFIAKVKLETGRRITRKDIWTVAGYGNATDFERFQRCDSRVTSGAETKFTHVLEMLSQDFIKLLEKKLLEKAGK